MEKNSTQLQTFKKKSSALMEFNKTRVKDAMLFSRDLGYKGAKEFLILTPKKLYNELKTGYTKSYYENIELSNRVKLHIDIDHITTETNSDKITRVFRELVRNTITTINTELIKYDIRKPEILVLRSNMYKGKISSHIIYNNVIFQDILHLKFFLMKMESDLTCKKIIDMSIYRVGVFRTLHSCKKGKNNKLCFVTGINYEQDDKYMLFCDSLVTYVDPKITTVDVQIDGYIKKNIKLRKNRNDDTDIVPGNYSYIMDSQDIANLKKAVEKIPFSFCKTYSLWITITFAFSDLYRNVLDKSLRSAIHGIWNVWCMKSDKYDKEGNDYYFKRLHLDFINADFIYIISNSKKRFRKIINYSDIKPKFDNYKTIVVNDDKINKNIVKDFEENDFVILISGQGTGKTTVASKLTANCDKPIISIIGRTSMAIKHAEDFELDLYTDCDFYKTKRLSIVINSLLKVCEENFEGGIVILDEFSKLQPYITSKLFDSTRVDIYVLFHKIIEKASKIIILDADLSERDIESVMRKNSNYYFYHNKFQNRLGISASVYYTPGPVIYKLLEDFKNKRPFVSCFDSLKQMKNVLYELEKHYTKKMIDELVVAHSSEHGEDSIDTDKWKGKCVFFSPSIVYGIDYNDVPTTVYAFCFKKILDPYSINQQIQRTRTQKEIHVYINDNYTRPDFFTIDEYKCYMYDRINKYNENNKQLQEFNSSGASDSIKTSYSNMYIKNGFVEMITKSYIPYYLKHILDDMGYTITVSKQVKKVKLENCEKYDDKHKSQIMEDILAGKQLNQNDYKLICSIKKRIEALGVTKDYNKLQKKLIINPTRFEQHRRLRTFLTHDIDKLVGRYKAHCFDEDMLGNIGMKLKYYKLVTDFLGVKYNILFDYESNIKNINKKVDDNAFLKQLNEINKVFRIRTKKYNTIDNFNLLYQLAVKMHIQLFGKHLIDIRYKNIIYGGKKYKPPIYQTNKKRLLEHIRIFSLESIGQVNVQLLDELGYKYDPFIDREEEMRHILRKCRKNNMIALREDILLKLSHMDIIRKRNEHLDRINQQIDEQYEELIKNMEN